MNSLSKAVGIGFLSLVCCLTLSTVAQSSADREVYDKPEATKHGKTMHGKVVKVDERDSNTQRWDVSVRNQDSGEVVVLHIDKTTTRKEGQMDPDIGDNVIVKYDETSKHAISFLTDARSHN
jgi:methyl coenzyme M reductase gamma subunit